jgi:hypothetical protein
MITSHLLQITGSHDLIIKAGKQCQQVLYNAELARTSDSLDWPGMYWCMYTAIGIKHAK